MEIAVSYLKTPDTLEQTIAKIEQTSAEYIHVDLADGLFVPNKNFNWKQVHQLLKDCQKDLDVHLMTLDLERNIEQALSLSPKRLAFHIEATKEINPLIQKIKQANVKVGLAINPSTKLNLLFPFLNEIDYVLVMSVEPGFGGQGFNPNSIEKIKQLKDLIKEQPVQIEVDGGINSETIVSIKDDVDVVVSGSYICESKDYESSIQILKQSK